MSRFGRELSLMTDRTRPKAVTGRVRENSHARQSLLSAHPCPLTPRRLSFPAIRSMIKRSQGFLGRGAYDQHQGRVARNPEFGSA